MSLSRTLSILGTVSSLIVWALIVSACGGATSTSMLPTSPHATSAAAPKVSYYGLHTGDNMAYVVGTFVSGTCYVFCSYPLATVLPPGYEQVEVLLTGWQAENLGGATPLHKLMLSARAIGYNPTNGNFDWEAAADIRANANAGDEYRFTLYFTIVLTKLAGARLWGFPIGCNTITGGQCQGRILVQNIIPPGWDFLAVGVRRFTLEAGGGTPPNGILLNRLAMNASRWRAVGADLVSYIECEMHDAAPTEPMSCQIEIVGIVTAPGEAFRVHFASGHTSPQFFSASSIERPPGLPVNGAFGGLERFLLTLATNQESKTWAWAADYNDILICPNMVDFCYNRIGFLGDTFGSMTNSLTFDMEIKGFGIWTRPP